MPRMQGLMNNRQIQYTEKQTIDVIIVPIPDQIKHEHILVKELVTVDFNGVFIDIDLCTYAMQI